MKFNEQKLVQDKTKLIATIKQILKPSNTSIKVEGGKDDSMVVTITKSDIDFVSNYAKVQTTVPNPAVIRVSQSIPGLKLQFDGEAYIVLHKLLNALSKEGLTFDKSTTPFISFKIVPKSFKYTGKNDKDLMEDAKQLIQNPILKVFDQFGKQYLAQVLDASLNKMIQAAAKRGAKVTVPQIIAEIQQNPKGQTAQVLFKAMATVIKQVSAQIPTIVSTNVSSISESLVFENTIDKKTFQTKLESIITPIFEKYGFKKSYGDGWIKEIGKNKTTGRVFLKSYKGTKRRYSVYPDQIETEQFYLEGQHSPTKDVVCMFDLKDTSPSYIQSACKEVSTLMDRYYGVK